MDWSNIIDLVTLLTVGGGIFSIATIQDKRMTLMLNNIREMLESNSKTNDAWEHLAQNKAQVLEILEEKCDQKDTEIDKLHKRVAELMTCLDKSRTARATAELLRCNRIACPDRQPPFGTVPEIVSALGNDDGSNTVE